MDYYQYPSDLFVNDPSSDSERPFISFIASEVKENISKAKSYADEFTYLENKGGFALPMPATNLTDGSNNSYTKASGVVAGFVNDLLPGTVKNIGRRAGIVPDPKYTMLYEGTEPRTWAGTWSFVPQSAEEAQAVVNILKSIKKYAAPERMSDASNKIGVLLQPYVFTITFSNQLIQKATQFDKMALISYEIDYFAQGYASTYSDNMPKSMTLTLNFSEYGIKTRKDWEDAE